MIKNALHKLLALVLFFIALNHSLYAQTESYVQALTGVIAPGDSCTAIDEKYADSALWNTIDKNIRVQDLITFELRFDTTIDFFKQSFSSDLIADINYEDSSHQQRTITGVHLTIQYDTTTGMPYKGIAYYKFKGGHKVTVKVTSITCDSLDITQVAFLRIKNQILIDRTYKSGGNSGSVMNGKMSTPPGKTQSSHQGNIVDAPNPQLELNWDGSGDIDLEYTFYDVNSDFYINILPSLTGDQLVAAFRNNATRVNPTSCPYIINLVYPQGVLLVRYRSFTYADNGDRQESPWIYTLNNEYQIYAIDNEHEANLNWQYNAVFAEEGKKKEVVSYFDGNGKSRQSVTIDNQTLVPIVQENILDNLNRPAANVLPVPVDTRPYFQYFHSLNLNTNNNGQPLTPYSYADLNTGSGLPTPMSTSSGASQYYSSNNTFGDAFRGNIPDANGYPFAVTEYTNDLTGRIRRQGGVGEKFQINPSIDALSHETTYYYGKPSQDELDRLFGSEAGAASHYSKNMVVDPNGQVSVSYVDMVGKTVATALAGEAPPNLKPLESGSNATTQITDELISPQQLVRDASNKTVSFNTTVLVPFATNDYTFTYEFSKRSLQLIFGWSPSKTLCADCYYDVKFSISDEYDHLVNLTYPDAFGNIQQGTSVSVSPDFDYGSSLIDNNPNTSCGVDLSLHTSSKIIHAAFPKAGEYKVHYELVMSATALAYYMDFLKQAKVMQSQDDYNKSYLQNIDLTGCFSDCKTCVAKLGDQSTFELRIIKVLEDQGISVNTTTDLPWIDVLYAKAAAACSTAVASNCAIIDGCADQRNMMLRDVTPGGQYMLYDETTLLFKERNDGNQSSVNIFLKCKAVESASPGTTPMVIVNGVSKPLGSLLEAELITNWQPEWAYLLLPYHPEYDLLVDCQTTSAIANRDKGMIQTDDINRAASDYNWHSNPSPLPTDLSNTYNYGLFLTDEYTAISRMNPLSATPPYSVDGVEAEILANTTAFIPRALVMTSPGVIPNPNNLSDYKSVSLWQFIKFLVYCDNKPAPVNNQYPYIDLSFQYPPTCDRPLDEWRIFRNLYTAIKQAAIRHNNTSTATNCYIGVNAFSSLYSEKADPKYYPKLNDFSIENESGQLFVKYNGSINGVNNRCDVHLFKAQLNADPIEVYTDANSTPFQFFAPPSGSNIGTTEIAITSSSIDDKDLYFVGQVINNYNHNLEGATATSDCSPNATDFNLEATGELCNGHHNNGDQYILTYIGKYPLLNDAVLYINWARYGCGETTQTLHPFETGPKTWSSYGGCVDNLQIVASGTNCNGDPVQSYFCLGTPASCISDLRWPSYFQKTRRFYQSSSVDDISTILNQTYANGNTNTTNSNSANYQSNCEALADGWLEKLKGCNLTPAQSDALKAGLIAICVGGSDLTHPFGASSLPQGAPPLNGSDHSFKDVMLRVLGAGYESTLCSDLLLDFPLPYEDHTLLNDQSPNTLSQCGYDLLSQFTNEWNATGPNLTLYPTLEVYIQKMYDSQFFLNDGQISLLMSTFLTQCSLERPITLPGILTQCGSTSTPTCLTCKDLYRLEGSFQSTGYSEDMPNYYELFSAYINRIDQMNVSPTAVYEAMQKCRTKKTADQNSSQNACDAPKSAILNTTPSSCANNGVITVTSITDINDNIITITGPSTTIEYNLDNYGWVNNNSFNDLYPGTHTLLIRFVCSSGNSDPLTTQAVISGNYQFDIHATIQNINPSFCHDGGFTVVATGNSGSYTYQLTDENNNTSPSQTSPVFNNLKDGTYSVRISDACGNYVSYSVVIPAGKEVTPFYAAPDCSQGLFSQTKDNCTGSDIYKLNPYYFGLSGSHALPLQLTVFLPNGTSQVVNCPQNTVIGWGNLSEIDISSCINNGFYGPFYAQMEETGCGITYTSFSAWFSPINSATLTTSAQVMKKCNKNVLTFNQISNSACYPCPIPRSDNGFDITPIFNYTGPYSVVVPGAGTFSNDPLSNDPLEVELPCSTSSQTLNLQIGFCGNTYDDCVPVNITPCSFTFPPGEINSFACNGNTGMYIAHDIEYVTDDNLTLTFTAIPSGQSTIPTLHLLNGRFVDENSNNPLNNLLQGDYQYTVTDNCNSNTYSSSVTLNHPHQFDYTIASTNSASCHYSDITMRMQNNSFMVPPPADYWPTSDDYIYFRNYYSIYFNNAVLFSIVGPDPILNGHPFLSDDGTVIYTSVTFTNISAGNYSATISSLYNSSMCPITKAISVTDALPDLSASLYTFCDGGSGTVSIIASGGKLDYIYHLYDVTDNNNSMTAASTTTPYLFTGLQADHNYRAEVTDACGSRNSVNKSFSQYAPIIKQLGLSCLGESVRLSTDFIPGATYVWSKDGSTSLPGNTNTTFNELDITNIDSYDYGTYSVIVTIPGCSSFTAVLTLSANTTYQINVNGVLYNNGSTVSVNLPSNNISVICSDPSISWSWSPGTYLNTTVGSSVIASFQSFGTPITYTVTGTKEGSSCTVIETITILPSAPLPKPGEWVLCSSPITPLALSDSNNCLISAVTSALSNADYAYKEYVDSFMRDYRESYFAKCMSISPSLVMAGPQKEYHYTLYYYDQSGNMVKTIPPKGVNILDDDQVSNVANLRNEDNGDCYEHSNAPHFSTAADHLIIPNGFYPLHNDGPLTLESWIQFDNGTLTGANRILMDQFDDDGNGNMAGYYASLDNAGFLHFSIFGRSTETWIKKKVQWLYPDLLPNVTAHTYIDDPGLDANGQPINPMTRNKEYNAECSTLSTIDNNGDAANFYHIVFQYNGDPNDPFPVKIFVNGILQPLKWTNHGQAHYDFLDGLADEPYPDIPTIDQVKYTFISTVTPFTTASSSPLTIGGADRTVNGETFSGLHASVKHLRIYNAAPDASDIRRSSYDNCFLPSSKDGLVLWLPLAHPNDNNTTTEDILSAGMVPINALWPAAPLPQYPLHNMPTYYGYNSLNKVIKQITPDAGESNTWYDRLGRVVASQNSEQNAASPDPLGGEPDPSGRYSYTVYDDQGRIIEVGEKTGSDLSTVDTKDDDQLTSWYASGTNHQITQTVYDAPNPTVTINPTILLDQVTNDNGRKRVITSLYKNDDDGTPSNYNSATHYVYDIAGNVSRLYQENKMLPNGYVVDPIASIKTIDYDFDLASGKVNKAWYQKGLQDQFVYSYLYDAENRIVEAWSGRDEATLQQDATYQYYLHGPLARTELGNLDRKVQGIDYAYTLQGWLKGINGVFLGNDLGDNGISPVLPHDVYAYSLGYYNGDYTPIDNRGGNHPLTVKTFGFNSTPLAGTGTGYELFNGNIAYSTNALISPNPQASSYQYDQLNRLTEVRVHSDFSETDGDWNASTTIDDYKESLVYDANGNIQTYLRNGESDDVVDMDNMQYNYQDPIHNNKLDFIHDLVPDANGYTKDLKDQATGNYLYDHIGNTIQAITQGISQTRWSVYGKMKSITKDDGTLIEYGYDPSGNRISETIRSIDGVIQTTYYFHDAQGNMMGVYKDFPVRNPADFNTKNNQNKDSRSLTSNFPYVWTEQHLYGSSHLGLWKPEILLTGEVPEPYDQTMVGSRQYELTDHLGNVRAVVTDKVGSLGQAVRSVGALSALRTPISYFPEILGLSDYYAFGLEKPERTFWRWDQASTVTVADAKTNLRALWWDSYPNSFNGKRDDRNVTSSWQNYGFREYDKLTGRFMSVDPLTKRFSELTPYQFASNSPIANVDLDGGESQYYTKTIENVSVYQQMPNGDTKLNSQYQNIDVEHVKAGVNGNGRLGTGTLYTVQTAVREIFKDVNGNIEVCNEAPVQAQRLYKFSDEDLKEKEIPVFQGKVQLMIFGSAHDDSESPGERPNPNAETLILDLSTFSEAIEPLLIGVGLKTPPDAPDLNDVLGDGFNFFADKIKTRALQNNQSDKYQPTTKVCPDCVNGDTEPANGANAYLLDERGYVTDTLKKDKEKVDTSPVKKENQYKFGGDSKR